MEKKLKIAVLGTGYWASLQVPSWMEAGAEIVAVWNRTYEKAVTFADKFGIPHVYKTPEDVFTQADFDIADIITDIEGHYPLVMMAAKYKKPVICQKPMANTFEECLEMVHACDEAGVWFAIHENFRYRSSLQRVKKILDSGTLGKIFWAHILMRSLTRERIDQDFYLQQLDHATVRNMGPHIFDISRFFFGEAETMYCPQTCTFPDLGVLDIALATMKMKSGALVQCELSTGQPPKIYISGENGSLLLDAHNTLTLFRDGKKESFPAEKSIRPDYIPPKSWEYHGEEGMLSIHTCVEDLSRSFLRGEFAKTNAAQYLKTMELVFQAIASCDENKVLKLQLN